MSRAIVVTFIVSTFVYVGVTLATEVSRMLVITSNCAGGQ